MAFQPSSIVNWLQNQPWTISKILLVLFGIFCLPILFIVVGSGGVIVLSVVVALSPFVFLLFVLYCSATLIWDFLKPKRAPLPEAVFDEGGFLNRNSIRIFTYQWLPQSDPVGIVFLIHGLGEHCFRYRHVANTLVQNNLAVYTLDHKGHGRSGGERCYFTSIKDLSTDVIDYVRHIKSKYPKKPLFLLGHSLGGMITVDIILREPELFDSFALSSPLLLCDPALDNPASRLIVKFLSKVAPRLPLVALDLTTLCGNPITVRRYIEDPYVYHGRLTPAVINAALEACVLNRKGMSSIVTPYIVLQGMKDAIVNPQGAILLDSLTINNSNKKLLLFENLYHEIFNEKDGQKCIDIVTNFFVSRVPKSEQ